MFGSTSGAMAAKAPRGKPTISITSPRDGTVIHGSTVTMHVAVSNFKLVTPLLLPPAKWTTIPLLKGNQGHIHYLLDGSLVLASGVSVQTVHTWTHLSPGQHTLTAYLATSQHAPFPGAKWAAVHITVASGKAGAPTSRASNTSTAIRTRAPSRSLPAGMGNHLPRTGGGAGGPGSAPTMIMLLGAVLLMVLGLASRTLARLNP
ncbi:MAG: hypothetical protein JOZ41_01900 [Chloroflexi bacterium]|nr:hypothetical protein [Chloroflexota bacterium]